ncbi:hypothetical protein G5B30_12205 [Sphingobacterium sp. SGG-5]|uniref:hypothetical protein n=1 Tax=Sphingobacterium sp. SGG-5 TaxID=2710881 RepID=UPI0013E9AE0B|nr:hypothetical protein [Sphingobacterium sp. SGG-5]NGM62678.1 hypothetical protein [Sphingobacterium sp. SGG-5]
MKNLIRKNAMALVALAIAAVTLMAMGTPESKLAMKKWGYNPAALPGAQWVDITGQTEETDTTPGQYLCHENEEQICSGEFEEEVNPNAPGAPAPSNETYGEFEPLD